MTRAEPRYVWSSIEFAGPIPWVWCHPENREPGSPDGVKLVFRTVEELQEMVSTLQGALHAIKNRKNEK